MIRDFPEQPIASVRARYPRLGRKEGTERKGKERGSEEAVDATDASDKMGSEHSSSSVVDGKKRNYQFWSNLDAEDKRWKSSSRAKRITTPRPLLHISPLVPSRKVPRRILVVPTLIP